MTAVLLAVRFALELCLLAAVATLGARAVDGTVTGLLLGCAAGLAVTATWGALLSPRRRIQAPLAARVVLELALYGAAAAGLATIGHPLLGALLAGAEVVDVVALAGLGRPPGSD